MQWRCSTDALVSFSTRRRLVLFEDVASVEVAVFIEVIMHRGVNGGKFLQGLYNPDRALCSGLVSFGLRLIDHS